jgi:hypothetical protein
LEKVVDIQNKNLTFHEARRPWDQWGIRETLGSINARWSNCTPSDIDSVIELNGYFLFIEDKPLSQLHNGVPDGQMRMYQNLIALSEKVTVWFLFGDKNNPEFLYSVRRGEAMPLRDSKEIMEMISQWGEFVNNKSKGYQ